MVWVREFGAQFTAGELYPRWLGGLWHGAGGPDFYFYAPLPFWVIGAIKLAICSGCAADQLLLIGGIVFLVVSGLGFRVLAGQFGSRWPAMIAALIFMALPFHLDAQWYARLAIGEFAAVALVPWHLASFIDFVKRRGSGPLLALLTGLIIMCHLPTAMIIAVAYVPAILIMEKPRGWRTLPYLLVPGLVGVGLGAIYWIPAMLLLDSTRSDLLLLPQFDWRLNILLPNNFGRNAFVDWVWGPFAVLSALALGAILLVPRGLGALAGISAAFLIAVWVMVTPLSIVIWEATPLDRIQFPWRFLLMSDVAFALAALIAAETLAKPNLSGTRRVSALTVLSAIAVVCVLEHPAYRGGDGLQNPARSDVRETAGGFGFLPYETERSIGVRSYWYFYDDAKRASEQPVARLISAGDLKLISQEDRRMIFEAELEAPGMVVFRRMFWRYWELTEMNSQDQIGLEPTEGFPLVSGVLPAGRGRYLLELPVLPAERLGAALSALALAGLLIWWWLSWRRRES
jgi:hypothetical protein